MKVVLPLVFSNSIALMAFSVRASKAEVGSSKMRISGSFNRALAMQIRCFSPVESLTPRSPTLVL